MISKLVLQVCLLWLLIFNQSNTPREKKTARLPKKPLNFVLILIDDIGWADVGFNGSTYYHTPNLDKLALQSMKFTNAYAASPVCSPTRAALLTGKYPARLQITDWLRGRPDIASQKLLPASSLQHLPLKEITIAEALKPAGYIAATIGKWHLGGVGFDPERQGFDVNLGGDHSGTPAAYFYPYINDKNPRRTVPGLEKGQKGEYLTDRLTDEAEAFITRSKKKPFLLYLPHYAVHISMEAKQELIDKYEISILSLYNAFELLYTCKFSVAGLGK